MDEETTLAKQIAYYDKMILPAGVRIVSEKLCLDHTFLPNSVMSLNCMTLDDIHELQNSGIFDKIMVCFAPNSVFSKEGTGKNTIMRTISGWHDISLLELHDLNSLLSSDEFTSSWKDWKWDDSTKDKTTEQPYSEH